MALPNKKIRKYRALTGGKLLSHSIELPYPEGAESACLISPWDTIVALELFLRNIHTYKGDMSYNTGTDEGVADYLVLVYLLTVTLQADPKGKNKKPKQKTNKRAVISNVGSLI